jgi:type I restriction enzyme, S subunit
MNAERLLVNYEQIADAPDAIARLRRFILDLAVRGKLVPQDSKDEPAVDVGLNIRTRSRGQVQEAIEPPYDLPAGWAWRAVDTLADQVTDGEHATPPRISESQVPLVTAKNVREGFMDYAQTDWVSFVTAKKAWGRCRPQVGDLLLVCVGATTGRLTVLREPKDMVLVRSVALIRPNGDADAEYLERAFRSPVVQQQIWASVKAAAQPCLYINRIQSLLIPLPPIAEQHRIVAKVDELMGLCDRLEAARGSREGVRDRLAAASLARLNVADPETFQADARFALDALPALTTRPDQISQLRQTILNLAVRGKLTAEGEWTAKPTTLGEVASLQNGYAFKSEWFSKVGTRLLRNANVGHGTLNWEDEVRLPDIQVPEYERFRLSEGDIVFSLDRPFIVTGTKVARVSSRDLPALLLQRVGRFVLSPKLHPDYLFLWINSPHFTEQIDPERSNGVPHISSKQVEAAVNFVPPLAEQYRIVAKVDALMALCDRLEASLTATADTRRRLLDALLADALAPAEDRELEAAE